jgi:hypothetical protein
MDARLELLVDKDAIIEVITRLFVSTDERDWQQVKACFADHVIFDMTSLAGGEPATMTPEQIVTGWEAGLRNLVALHHQVGNFLVEVDGDEAETCCYGIASHYLPNPSGRDTRSFVGSYDFHLCRIEARWRIDRFRFNLKYSEGNLELRG